MRKPLALAVVLTVVAGSGALTWWKLRPEPPPEPSAAEKSYEDIDREKYEQWMQDLGYTD
jgi:hypothetical protein